MPQRYCLDANVLIEAWNKYYSPQLCPTYWEVLKQLGAHNVIFLPKSVAEEILRADDELAAWLKTSGIPVENPTQQVGQSLAAIFRIDRHKTLVDNVRGRSQADPWVIGTL